jgi:hypothetical protein
VLKLLGAPLDAVHLVALLQQQLRQIAAVLPGDAGDQSHAALAVLKRGTGGHRLGKGLERETVVSVGDAKSLKNSLRDSVQAVRKSGQCLEG